MMTCSVNGFAFVESSYMPSSRDVVQRMLFIAGRETLAVDVIAPLLTRLGCGYLDRFSLVGLLLFLVIVFDVLGALILVLIHFFLIDN